MSANATLVKLDPPADGFSVTAQIAWPEGAVPILRLAPAEPKIDEGARPTVYWTLDNVGGTTTNPVVGYSVEDLYKKPIKSTVNVIGADKFTRIRSSITVQSSALTGLPAKNAAFVIESLDTSDQGVFEAFLPPGTYTFRATPIDSGLAVTDHEFTVEEDVTCFCGQELPLGAKPALGGAVKTPSGERVAGATVTITPALGAPRPFWNAVHGLAPLAARQVSTSTSDDGNFSLLVDDGLADVVIQTDAGSGFPWLVRPRFKIESSDDIELGSLALTNPAVLSGTVRDPNGVPVANAEVNAWFPVRDPSAPNGLAGTVVKIATTQTDANGNYRLVMPSSIGDP
ncbi:MAG: hypothetical protein QM820_60820 [Minicystis sp.]